MQPTCRHVPPRYGSFSTTTVFKPSSPARIAATYPPGPLPIIATSYFATRSLPSAGARTGERSCLLTAVTLDKSSRGFRPIRQVASLPLCGSLFKTHKKPPTLTAQTAASRQTCNFSSGTRHSQPEGKAEQIGDLSISKHSVRPVQARAAPPAEGSVCGPPIENIHLLGVRFLPFAALAAMPQTRSKSWHPAS